MTVDWAEVTAEDIKASQPNALATGPFGSSISSRFFQGYGIPVIRGSNLSEDVGVRLVHEDIVFISKEKAKEFERSIVRHGDLVFTCWGTIGQVGLIDGRCLYPEYVISNKQMKITPDPNKADSLFLYYLFSGPEMSERIRNQAIGSSVPGFNLGQLRSLRFQLPSLPEQYAIARILGTLDDKIELDRHMNHTLEEMARAIFKSWFVDFDPIIAKSEGRQPYGMNAETAALFPSAFQDSEFGLIPRGWRVAKLGDVCELAYGKSLTANNRCPGNAAVFGSDGQIGWHNAALVKGPGIVIGRKGNAGKVNWSQGDFFPIDTTFYVQLRMDNLPLNYLFYALELLDLPNVSGDSAVPGLSREMAYSLDTLIPAQSVLEVFERLLSPLRSQIDANERESRTLAAIRDALLPKLLSGEIRVNQVEEIQ